MNQQNSRASGSVQKQVSETRWVREYSNGKPFYATSSMPLLGLIDADVRFFTEDTAEAQYQNGSKNDLRFEFFDYSTKGFDFVHFSMAILSLPSMVDLFRADEFDEMPDYFFILQNLAPHDRPLETLLLFCLSQHPIMQPPYDPGAVYGLAGRELSLMEMEDEPSVPAALLALACELNITQQSVKSDLVEGFRKDRLRDLLKVHTQRACELAPLVLRNKDELSDFLRMAEGVERRTPDKADADLVALCASAAQAIYGSGPEVQLEQLRRISQNTPAKFAHLGTVVFSVCTNSKFPDVRLAALDLLS
jgi:hypothetical protein